MRKLILILSIMLAVACQKDDSVEMVSLEQSNQVEIIDYMDAFNNLNLPVDPQPSTGKGSNWLDIAWFSINGQSHVYVRSDNYEGAETCYAFVDETLASYTLTTSGTLILEQGANEDVFDVENGLYDDVFATSYNTLFDTTTAGVITNPSTTAVSSLALDGDCLLGGLIDDAADAVAVGTPTLNNHNKYIDKYSYGYKSDGISLVSVGSTAEIAIAGLKVPEGKTIKYILVATWNEYYGKNLYKDHSTYNGKYELIFEVSDDRKFAVLEVSERLGQKFIVEMIETNYSGSWTNSYTYFQVIYSDIDTDGDGVINFEDTFPDDPTEYEDDDNDGVGNNSDLLPKTKNTNWNGWLYGTQNLGYYGNDTTKDWEITEFGKIIAIIGTNIYVEGHKGTDGDTGLNFASPLVAPVIYSNIIHSSVLGGATVISDPTDSLTDTPIGTYLYQLTEKE